MPHFRVAVRWASSAGKHGIERGDILHAILNHTHRLEEFDEPRVGTRRPDLFIGPTRDRSQLLEVVVVVTPPADLFIFHAMIARRKMLDIAERSTND